MSRNTVNVWDHTSHGTSQCLKQFRWSACTTIFVVVPVPRGVLYSPQILLTIRNQDGSESHLQSARKKIGDCKLYKNVQKLPWMWISSTKIQSQEPLSSSYNHRAVNAYSRVNRLNSWETITRGGCVGKAWKTPPHNPMQFLTTPGRA